MSSKYYKCVYFYSINQQIRLQLPARGLVSYLDRHLHFVTAEVKDKI